jgi:hypothetical protein
MSLTLTIGGTNYKPQYKTGSANIRERLANAVNTMSLTLVLDANDTMPTEGAEIVFADGACKLFGGFVTHVQPYETGEGQLFNCHIEASDYQHILGNKVVAETYSGETLADIYTRYVYKGFDGHPGVDIACG